MVHKPNIFDVINPGPVNDIRRRARNSVYGPVNQSFLK
jgi:hypothetical protein